MLILAPPHLSNINESQRGVGIKTVSSNELQFTGGNPSGRLMLPGVMQIGKLI